MRASVYRETPERGVIFKNLRSMLQHFFCDILRLFSELIFIQNQIMYSGLFK